MRLRQALLGLALAVTALCALPAMAQSQPAVAGQLAGDADQQESIQTGGMELRVWSGGGFAPNAVTKGDGVWNVGFRVGWLVTPAFIPGFFRGRLEYAFDVVPVFVVYQPTGPDYGVSLFPVDLKWVFDTHGRVVPYWEFDGGVLYSLHTVPERPYGSAIWNLLPSAAFGAHFKMGKFDWSADVRYLHISDAGTSEPNFGINTIEFRVGFGTFLPPHHKEKSP